MSSAIQVSPPASYHEKQTPRQSIMECYVDGKLSKRVKRLFAKGKLYVQYFFCPHCRFKFKKAVMELSLNKELYPGTTVIYIFHCPECNKEL